MACFVVPVAEAVITTIAEKVIRKNEIKSGILCSMFWGASLMWLVDAVAEYMEAGAEEYFNPAAADMINDAFLGMCVVALAMVIWTVSLLVRDPKKVVVNILKKKN